LMIATTSAAEPHFFTLTSYFWE